MIAAIKEANGNFSKIAETIALVGDKLDVYSGSDNRHSSGRSFNRKGNSLPVFRIGQSRTFPGRSADNQTVDSGSDLPFNRRDCRCKQKAGYSV